MDKFNKYLFLTFIFITFTGLLFAKDTYLITLKGGTKIKAESYIEKKDYIKVFKYGGYIIYPKKNVKKIEKIVNYSSEKKLPDNKTSKKNKVSSCKPVVKNLEAVPVYDKDKDGFNIEISGIIENNCPKILENVKLTINFFNEKNENIFTKTLPMDDISSYDSYKFHKIITDNYKGNIKYYTYKFEFLKK